MKKIQNLHRDIPSKAIEFVTKKTLQRKGYTQMASLMNSTEYLKESLHQSQIDKDITRKLQTNIPYEYRDKIFHKILGNQIQQHVKWIIHQN